MAEPTEKLSGAAPSDALKLAGQQLLSLLVQRAAEAATERVSGVTDRLTSVSENGGQGLAGLLRGKKDSDDDDADDDDSDDDDGDDGDDGDDDGGSGGGFFSGLKDKVKNMFGGGGGGGGGGGKKLKVTQIVEDRDVGLPLRTTYDLWTQFADFPSFMKKVESVEQVSDEKTHWKAQVFLSHREWEATILEQVPDSHIVWRSQGAKGHVDGAVTFTALGPNLTRILLVLEYYPQGLFERTGNIWRAQGRRARLEFHHFRRHAMVNVLVRQEEVEGWRGEIRDSEVVRTHEEALEQEQAESEQDEAGQDEAGQDEDRDAAGQDVDDDDAGGEESDADEDSDAADEDDEFDDEADDEAEDEADDEDDDEAEDEAEDEDEDDFDDELEDDDEPEAEDDDFEDEDEDEDDDDEEPEAEDEPDEDEPPRRTSRRRTAAAGGRRGR